MRRLAVGLLVAATLAGCAPVEPDPLVGRIVAVRDSESFVVDCNPAPAGLSGRIVVRGDAESVIEGLPGRERVVGIRNAIVDDLVGYPVSLTIARTPDAAGSYRLMRLRSRVR
ncbi:MAG: hypothetical protein FJ104_13480 [Deltaproteobacteria bacterium]|nr:hypothetical protein [Deltaproteobacteria bacterium]